MGEWMEAVEEFCTANDLDPRIADVMLNLPKAALEQVLGHGQLSDRIQNKCGYMMRIITSVRQEHVLAEQAKREEEAAAQEEIRKLEAAKMELEKAATQPLTPRGAVRTAFPLQFGRPDRAAEDT